MKKKAQLREMQESDLPQVLRWRNAPEIRKNMYNHDEISWDDHVAWFNNIKVDSSNLYFIFEYEDIPSGVISFSQIEPRYKRAYWAFYSGRLEARGMGTQMELLALEFAFETLKLNKLCCEVLSFNESVIKFHRKFGFVEEGIQKDHYIRDGRPYDIHLLAIFQKNWLDTKKKYYEKLVK